MMIYGKCIRPSGRLRQTWPQRMGFSKQAARVVRIARALSQAVDKSLVAKLQKELKAIVTDSLKGDDWLAIDQVVSQTNFRYFDPSDLSDIAQAVRQALDRPSLASTSCLNIMRTLSHCNYVPDPSRDSSFYSMLKPIAFEDPNFLFQLMEYISLPNAELKLLVDQPSLERKCVEVAQAAETSTSVEAARRYYRVVKNGIIHGLWSNQFKSQRFCEAAFAGSPLHQSLRNLIQFDFGGRLRDLPIQPRKLGILPPSNTQAKIGKYLEQLGYVFESGPKLSGFEVDFLIGHNIVLEYNGYSHYLINDPYKLTQYFAWKYRKLAELGCQIVLIQWRDWEPLERKEKQMEQLVTMIESSISTQVTRSWV